MRARIEMRRSFVVLLAALWCVDETNALPLFLLAAALHEAGHLLALRLSDGRLHRLVLSGSGAVLRCALPRGRCARTAICLAGPAMSFALTAAAGMLGAWRLAGASALLGLFNLLPMPPLDGGMALFHLCDGKFLSVRRGIALISAAGLLLAGLQLLRAGGGIWLLLIGGLVLIKYLKSLANGSYMV
nr:site-2 protease family protein [uncultured Agathobaculum sp.]